MSSRQSEVDAIIMGATGYAPLNSTIPSLYAADDGGTANRNVLTVAGAASKVLNTTIGVRTIRFKPSVVPTSPIFIKWHTASVTTAASATVFDEVLVEGDAAGIQLGIMPFTTGYSIYSAVSQTIYTIEN